MSDVDKNEFKREYLPLVNHPSQGENEDQVDPLVNNKSVISQNFSGNENKYSAVKMQNAGEQTFYQKNKKIILIAGGILLTVGVVLAIVLPLTLGGGGGDGPHPDPDNPVQPDPYQYQEFNPYSVDPDDKPKISTFQATFRLKYNNNAFGGHDNVTETPRRLQDIPASIKNFMGLDDEKSANAVLDGTSYRPMNPKYIQNSQNNIWAQNVDLSVSMNSNFQARVLLTNADTNPNETLRRQVNSNLFNRPPIEIEARLQQVGFEPNTTGAFAFNFTDIYSKETVVTSTFRKMVLTDFYSEIGLVVPTQRCFGLGQRNGQFMLDQGTYSFNARARDDGLPQDDGLGGKSSNHIHPFVLCQTEVAKDFFGIYFASTGPQVFEVVKFYNSTKMVINYITIGGVIEFYVMMRGSAQEIVSRYHNLVGMPMMPSYYALGVFHGSNDYASWTKIKAVYDNYNGVLTGEKQALEGVFVETFNQQPHWTFTVNPTNFPNLGAQVDAIHANNQRIIFGASLALANDGSFPWYAQASKAQCLIRSHASLAIGPLTGVLDQTTVQYLDSFSGCFDSFMASTLPAFDSATAHGLDGLLVKDAHTPNHINGQVITPTESAHQGRNLLGDAPETVAVNEEMVGFFASYQNLNDTVPRDLSTYYLPFTPAFAYSGALDNMTISLNSTCGDDLGGGRYSTLFVRNGLAGNALKRTYNAVNTLKKGTARPLLFSDSSFAGSGAYSVGLVTDLYRSWSNMQSVIGQVLALSMHGMSAAMVDTCGSLGPMDEELCTRWTQLATYMPMVRNYHNSTYRDPETGDRRKTQASEPWTAKTDIAKLAYAALGDRLRFSRYMYTQMYLTHTQGGSLVKPLFFDFPKDDETFTKEVVQSSYMLGDSIKVSPLVEQQDEGTQYQAYFPQGLWVDLYTPQSIVDATKGGKYAPLYVDASQPNIHQKSGTIIPYLNNNLNLRTTRDIETTLRTSVKIVRDPLTQYAEGHLMLDDGVTPNVYSPPYMNIYQHEEYDKNFTHYTMRMVGSNSENTLSFAVVNGDSAYKAPAGMSYQQLEQIDVMNAEDIKSADFACAVDHNWVIKQMNVYYTDGTKTLTIKPVTPGSLTFDQLMLVKFGSSKTDTNFCSGLTYKANDVDETPQYVRYNLTSMQSPNTLEQLVAEFTLLDDEGSIMVEITTASDFDSDKTKLFRPPQPEFYDLSKLKQPTKNLFDFIDVVSTPFSYNLKNAKGDYVYKSDAYKLLITEHFVSEGGLFNTNRANGNPIMGLGERAGRHLLKGQSIHTIWPQDQPNPIDDGKAPGKNMYGYQPVYYYQSNTTEWVAVFDVGTYATEYFVSVDSDSFGLAKVNKIAVGGMIQKIILQAPLIEKAIKKYQQITGYQTVPPMWAFGWNQCKFGYYNSDLWWGAYQNYTTFNLPLDTMWADIDYMDDYKVFTISEQTYSDLPAKVQQIKKDGRFFVPIIDNAIAVRKDMNYAPYDTGVAEGVFIMTQDLKEPATGGVWPGQANYPDFFQAKTVSWWKDNLQSFNEKVAFDGIWLDMNEPSSTCTGYCDPTQKPADPIKYKLPYTPGARDLEVQALGLDTVNPGMPKKSGGYWTHMEARSLYAIKESQATQSYLTKDGKRAFVLSRSNAPGLQKYAFSWLADNWSKTEWMQTSIDSIYNYNLFGIPMMGSDICGFNLDATPELCTRWHQLGSFYPFARNHKNSVWKQTEPFQFNFTVPDLDDGRTYTDLIRTALLQRYSLLRYIYSSFHHIGEQGGAFFKPLYYEFQEDSTTFDAESTERNILLGNALKLSIQVQDLDQVSTQYQFPSARWCQVMPTIDPTKCWDTSVDGTNTLQRLDSGIADYQVHLRGGRLFPYQNAAALKVNKSGDLMTAPTELIVLTNAQNGPIEVSPTTYTAQAAGVVYLDDGFSATDTGRCDISVVANQDGTFTIDFNMVKKLKNEAGAGKAGTLSAITFLWASTTGYQNIGFAKVTEVTGGSIDLNPPMYDPVTDTLRVNLANTQAEKFWEFWDIDKIVLTNSN